MVSTGDGFSVLVSGSRNIDDKSVVYQAIRESPWSPDTIIHGDASGVDELARKYAIHTHTEYEVHEIPDWAWATIGRKCGPLRNGYMVEQADAVVAIWDGESSGTKDTITQAEADGLPVYKVLCSETARGWEIDQTKLVEDDQACLTDFDGGSQ